MATVATRREKNLGYEKVYLTATGLLMEGDYTSLRRLFAFLRVNERDGDFSPVTETVRSPLPKCCEAR
jgi:hypothetical protein